MLIKKSLCVSADFGINNDFELHVMTNMIFIINYLRNYNPNLTPKSNVGMAI